jgi:hypothetical protein
MTLSPSLLRGPVFTLRLTLMILAVGELMFADTRLRPAACVDPAGSCKPHGLHPPR